jgi:mono/diheme cytochrome c family protein
MRPVKIAILLMAGLGVIGAAAIAVSAEPVEQLFDGKYRYRSNCAGCHAPDGTGIYAFGPALKGNAFVQNAPTPVLVTLIQKGRNYRERSHVSYMGMPAFPYIRAGEAEALALYLKGELQQAQTPQ